MKPLNLYFTNSLVFFLVLLWAQNAKSHKINLTIPYHVGVILDHSSSSMGQMANSCISMGILDFYTEFSHYKTRLVLHNKDSKGDPLQALSQAIDLLQNYQAQAIIGPQSSNEAEFLVNLGVKAEIPIISFSARSPFLSHAKTPYFVRVANNDIFQVKAIAALIQEFRWREVTLMYEDSSNGHGVIPDLISALDEIRARVSYRSVISPLATDNEMVIELYKLMTMSTRVYVVHMSSTLAYRVFLKVNELGMMSKGYAWIVMDGITSTLSSMNSSLIALMQGVVGIRTYVPHSKKLNDFFTRWGSAFVQANKSIGMDDLNRHCLWAYDAIWALAISTEKLGNKASENNIFSSVSLANLTSIPVSQTGSELLKLILQSKFDGISGLVELKNGELKPLAFEIINIVGESVKGIGFWTFENGISQRLGWFNNITHSDSSKLPSPLWPGQSIETPRGWIMPVGDKKLRIGVPMKIGFHELVKVVRDPQTNAYRITGFCVDVFRAAVDSLPYAVPFEFVPFGHPNGTNYNDLINEVYLQRFDAAVGDITITSNRSFYVDFTLPFFEGGIAVVRTSASHHPMWVFLEPLTLDLWLVILGFFIWTGMVIWAIEHRANNESNDPAFQQIGNMFSHTVSNLVFAPGGNLVQGFSKFVVITWIFAVFILTSSYTASLSSLLTTRQLLQCTELYNNLNYKDMRLKPFRTKKDFVHALERGSQHGGVPAIIDEIPYIKLFLAKYPVGYTMINATYDSGGFGFAFPKRSPLVPDLSDTITKLRESGRLKLIEQAWFGSDKSFINEESPPVNVLNSYNFRGLFIIMGITSVLALVTSHFFMKNTTNIPSNEVEGDEVNGTGAEEHILPSDNSPLPSALVTSDHSSDR